MYFKSESLKKFLGQFLEESLGKEPLVKSLKEEFLGKSLEEYGENHNPEGNFWVKFHEQVLEKFLNEYEKECLKESLHQFISGIVKKTEQISFKMLEEAFTDVLQEFLGDILVKCLE